MHPRNRSTRRPAPEGSAGFTLIELLVVLGVLGIAMVLGIPAIQNLIIRSKTEGYVREASTLLQRTRLEAIKMNRDGVVHLDPANRQLVAFIDADRNGSFNPDPDEPPRTTDYVLGRLPLPSNVEFEDESGKTGKDSAVGDTEVVVGGAPQPAVIFRPNGSIADPGIPEDGEDDEEPYFAFRISDVRRNHLEVRISPPATGRVEIRKYDYEATQWLASGDPSEDGFKPWKWY